MGGAVWRCGKKKVANATVVVFRTLQLRTKDQSIKACWVGAPQREGNPQESPEEASGHPGGSGLTHV